MRRPGGRHESGVVMFWWHKVPKTVERSSRCLRRGVAEAVVKAGTGPSSQMKHEVGVY